MWADRRYGPHPAFLAVLAPPFGWARGSEDLAEGVVGAGTRDSH